MENQSLNWSSVGLEVPKVEKQLQRMNFDIPVRHIQHLDPLSSPGVFQCLRLAHDANLPSVSFTS